MYFTCSILHYSNPLKFLFYYFKDMPPQQEMINQSKPRILWSILLYDGVIGTITTKACKTKMLRVFEYRSILHLQKGTMIQAQKCQVKQCTHV